MGYEFASKIAATKSPRLHSLYYILPIYNNIYRKKSILCIRVFLLLPIYNNIYRKKSILCIRIFCLFLYITIYIYIYILLYIGRSRKTLIQRMHFLEM